MKSLVKIFKPLGSKRMFLTLLVLVTGMISALSMPVFAENGGGVTQLELPPATENALMGMGILTMGPDGNPYRTNPNPPDVDTVILDFSDTPIPADFFGSGSDPFTGQITLEGGETNQEGTSEEEPILIQKSGSKNIIMPDSESSTGQVTSGGETGQEGTTRTSIMDQLDLEPSSAPVTGYSELDKAVAALFGVPLNEEQREEWEREEREWEEWEEEWYDGDPDSWLEDPDSITNNAEDVLSGCATSSESCLSTVSTETQTSTTSSTTEAEETVSTTETTTTEAEETVETALAEIGEVAHTGNLGHCVDGAHHNPNFHVECLSGSPSGNGDLQ